MIIPELYVIMMDPYVYDGTNVLINLANIKEQDKLDNYETTSSRIAIIELLRNPIDITSKKIFLKFIKDYLKKWYKSKVFK